MDIYVMTENPETCRKCGTRTDIIEDNTTVQKHQCPKCSYTYLLEDDEEFEDE